MLSIVIPTFNEQKFLPLILASISQQNFTDYEIIVSDGESTDDTLKIASDFGCKITTDSRRHPTYQRNNGARLAQGDLILFLDADTILPANFLTSAISQFKKYQLTSAGFYIRYNPSRIIYKFCDFIFNFFCFVRQYFAPVAVGAAILVKTSAHHQVGGFDETIVFAEDFDYVDRLGKIGRFKMLVGIRVLFSARRLERDGVLRVLWQWIRMGSYTLFNIPIRKKIIKYDLGDF
jgi:glycosyltransferase involved in cell wall biosynthesis